MPERSSKHKRPVDVNQLAKSIVDDSTDEERPEATPEKNPAAVALGRLGGRKGGKARAEKLSPEQRREIAKKAAAARWGVGRS
jgi:hypothetical protein